MNSIPPNDVEVISAVICKHKGVASHLSDQVEALAEHQAVQHGLLAGSGWPPVPATRSLVF